MKKIQNLVVALVAVALAVGFAPNAGAANSSAGIVGLGRLKWNRGISSYGLGVGDSTRISIPNGGPSADISDTTVWVDLSAFDVAQQYTEQCALAFQINRQLGSSTDSVGYYVQYTNDISRNGQSIAGGNNNTIAQSSAAYVNTVTATTANVTSGTDGFVTIVCAVKPKTNPTAGTLADFAWRFARLVVVNQKNAGTRCYFSVDAVIAGASK